MNKTVNINLANTFFHIDEEAYHKLRRYLEAIRRSFSGTSGSDEIIADIESRIAELFTEKMEHERQVITQKEVDEVINVMGQPEDYMVDEDIFEDEPKAKASTTASRVKKLYRDTDEKYIGGVCSGLEHYLGFDALWIRLIFLLLGVFSGFGIIAYILLWILVPEAATTSQKLDMRGEPINISNIERKVKEGFDDVADRVKNVDYEKVGNKVKSSSKTFFDTIGDVFMFLFKVFGKFIGILLIIIGATTLIGLFVGLFSVGVLDLGPLNEFENFGIIQTGGAPVWAISLLMFLAVGIPFFFLMYLGLKILVTNLKSIGNIAKYTLLGIWLISLGIIIALGLKEAASHAFTGTMTINESMEADHDTLLIKMRSADNIDLENRLSINGMKLVYDESGNALFYDKDVIFDIRQSKDSMVRLKIKKDADGASFDEARERAGKIDYGYSFSGNEIILNDYLTTPKEHKARDQQIRSTLYIPEDTYVLFDRSAKGNVGRSTKNDKDYYRSKIVDYQWVMGSDGELKCLDCPDDPNDEWEDDEKKNRVIINEDGIDINIEEGSDSFKMKIDEEGIEIKADDH